MNTFIVLLALIMAGLIGSGLAFLICAFILNKSNSKGDSRSKYEDFSSPISYYQSEDNLKHNTQAFIHLTELNIEVMCRSNEYRSHLKKSLPFASKDPVTRYIPNSNEDATSNHSRDPVIFAADSINSFGTKKLYHVNGFETTVAASPVGTFRTLSGENVTSTAYNTTRAGLGTTEAPSSEPALSDWAQARAQAQAQAQASAAQINAAPVDEIGDEIDAFFDTHEESSSPFSSSKSDDQRWH